MSQRSKFSITKRKTPSSSKLQVILIKIQRTTRLNELLQEHVKEILMKVSPEITENPPMVRFMTNDLFRICYMTEDKLRDYPNEYLISVEKYLRSTRFTSTEKDKSSRHSKRISYGECSLL
ncbi:hypothetical protein POM88_049650 [Heracleum sosnowskyi]|uniref:Uncharacterized protein n=1 Tax=Heracleum sosnowskyi TaxID=360622 RepID=A0AAD8GXC3_9APIA|nr:hypothetical protein POM88_049650 [Heracleum sosnowskyi]